MLLGALLALSLGLSPSCASLDFTRDTQSSGTFRSSGWSFTILTWDFPELAEQIARENASDANLPNMVVQDVYRAPALGWFDWILNIIGVRYARIRGTWGFSGE
ncbi:MAG: hypothetical protein AAF368_01995 [Planctomycetota bacterium]